MLKRKVIAMVVLGVITLLSIIQTAGAYYEKVTIAPDVKVGAQGGESTLADGYKTRIVLTIRSGSVVALTYLAVRTGSTTDGGGTLNSGLLKVTGAIVIGNSTSYGGRGGAMSNSGSLTGTFRHNLSFRIRTLPTNLRKPIDHLERLPIGAQGFVQYHLTFTTAVVVAVIGVQDGDEHGRFSVTPTRFLRALRQTLGPCLSPGTVPWMT